MRNEICTFDYAVIRVVPRVEREEFVNVGVILSCPEQKFLEARIEPDWQKLKVFAPELDLKMLRKYLEIIPKICAGDESAGIIGKLSKRERFYWLTAQRSTIIQTSPVHTGFCSEPKKMLDLLFDRTVR